jgi:hypothetical protein
MSRRPASFRVLRRCLAPVITRDCAVLLRREGEPPAGAHKGDSWQTLTARASRTGSRQVSSCPLSHDLPERRWRDLTPCIRVLWTPALTVETLAWIPPDFTQGSRVLESINSRDRLPVPCPPYGNPEDAQGSPRFRETLIRSFRMTLTPEATVGFDPTHRGFAGPGSGDSDPWSPFASFRIRVSRFWAAWRTHTLDRLLGPGNRQ